MRGVKTGPGRGVRPEERPEDVPGAVAAALNRTIDLGFSRDSEAVRVVVTALRDCLSQRFLAHGLAAESETVEIYLRDLFDQLFPPDGGGGVL